MIKYLLRALACCFVLTAPVAGMSQELASIRPVQAPSLQRQPDSPQKLREALVDLGKHHGISILFDESTVRDRVVETSGGKGSGRLEAQLESLLKPHGLKFKRIGKKAIVILPREESQAAAPGNPAGDFPPRDTDRTLADAASVLAPGTHIDRQITGRITDEKGEGLPGVSIVVRGSAMGTTTQIDGHYRLTIPEGDVTVIFSFVGYLTREVVVGNRSTIDLQMEVDKKALDEVVVVGYGVQKKNDLTGSVAILSSEDIKDLPVSSIDQKMIGRIPGVQIRQGSGAPGAGSSVRIRGVSSISAGNEPLYVVDGMPYSSEMNQNSNPLLFINPADIESISILKDASSTAIYGSRGSNGVVLITTKKGSYNKTKISVSSMAGIQSVPHKGRPDMMNQHEFADMQREMIALKLRIRERREATAADFPAGYTNLNSNDPGTDWFDLIMRNAKVQDHTISFSKGSDASKYGFSLGYFNQEGVVQYTGMERYSARLNFESALVRNLRIGSWLAPSFIRQNRANTNTSRGDVIGIATWANPVLKPYDDHGNLIPYLYAPENNYFKAWGFPNPLFILKEVSSLDKNFQNVGNAYLEWDILPGLRFKSVFSTIWDTKEYEGYTPRSVGGQNVAPTPSSTGTGTFNKSHSFNWLLENTVDYSKSFKRQHLNVLLGYTTQAYRSSETNIVAAPYTSDLIRTLNAAQAIQSWNQIINEWSMISYLGRINYTVSDKYLFTASFRVDGSSRFGAMNRYASFPSVAAAWKVNQENFLKDITWIDELKVRGSYGKGGNNNIGNYSSVASIQAGDYIINGAQVSGLSVGLGNPFLTWEKSDQVDIGIDASAFAGRISLTLDVYNRKSQDMLLVNRIPAITGFTSQTVNLGSLQNKGVEIGLGTHLKRGELTWSLGYNMSFNRNKVLSLNSNDDPIVSHIDGTTSSHITKVGKPIGQFHGFIWDGIYTAADMANPDVPKYIQAEEGAAKFKDLNGDGIISDELDFDIIGDPTSKFFFGFNNNFTYRRFDLSIVTQGDYGGKIINGLRRTINNTEGFFNIGKEWVNRWRSAENPGDGIHHGLPSGAGRGHRPTQLWVEDSSYWRIANVTLGYTFQNSNSSKPQLISNCRIYLTCQNLALFTKYSGYNPEAQQNTPNNALMPGWDTSSYPLSRTVSLGINLTY